MNATRTRTLDGTLRAMFECWYPGLANDNQINTVCAAAAVVLQGDAAGERSPYRAVGQATRTEFGREHHKAWESQAAAAGVGPFWSLAARPGYHLANVARSVPSSTRARVCSSRCAPRDDHCIC